MFSVLVLTLNEERNLPACLASARASDDLVVLDSGSSDRTCEIARALGARVFSHPFENFAQQRNHANGTLPFRHPWVFHLDADERLTPELSAELADFQDRGELDGCWAAPKMLFRGRWIRRCTDFPAWQARFVKAREFTFVQHGHGQREDPRMRLAYLRNPYLHEVAPDGEAAWLEKHRRYARAEAEREHTAKGRRRGASWDRSDALQRRRWLKEMAAHLPARPLARWLYQAILRGGVLDGPAGWRYCGLVARYEGFIAHERRQLRRKAKPCNLG